MVCFQFEIRYNIINSIGKITSSSVESFAARHDGRTQRMRLNWAAANHKDQWYGEGPGSVALNYAL